MSTAVIGAPEFRARSGRTVRANGDGSVTFQGARGYLGPEQVSDAEEFFQAREDARRGRWRDPLNPDYVVYPSDGDSVIVVDERDGMSMWLSDETAQGEDPYCRAARAYFDAHPVRKPWEGATECEIWALTFESGSTSAWVRSDGYWHLPDNPDAKLHLGFSIVDGRRIWPEDAA